MLLYKTLDVRYPGTQQSPTLDCLDVPKQLCSQLEITKFSSAPGFSCE